MGFRLRKSIKVGKHLRINLSKSGIGYSIGTKGHRVTKLANGRTRTTTSIPGTGISYVQETGSRDRRTDTNYTSSEKANGFIVPGIIIFCILLFLLVSFFAGCADTSSDDTVDRDDKIAVTDLKQNPEFLALYPKDTTAPVTSAPGTTAPPATPEPDASSPETSAPPEAEPPAPSVEYIVNTSSKVIHRTTCSRKPTKNGVTVSDLAPYSGYRRCSYCFG